MTQVLVDVIADMRENDAIALAQRLLDGGAEPLTILDDCRTAMAIVGQRFQVGEYFLPELILAGEMMKDIAALVKPRLQQTHSVQKRATVVLGTVKGDIHDIGKDIVAFMSDVNGFEVHDLGVDVPAQTFVDKIATVKPDVVALSGFLTVVFASMKETVEAIGAVGLRDQVKIMIGGGTVDDTVRAYVGADAFGKDAMAAVALAKAWAA
ncbi:MAG: cobalamin B12-binding domain-containing protein [Chloroflexi bacterium]|nr:cobalamin B12-binding domain-containing protein [Chloroflexota bacterium]